MLLGGTVGAGGAGFVLQSQPLLDSQSSLSVLLAGPPRISA
jgi:hypothetical protein